MGDFWQKKDGSRVRLPWQPGPQVSVFPKYIGIGILNMQYEKNR